MRGKACFCPGSNRGPCTCDTKLRNASINIELWLCYCHSCMAPSLVVSTWSVHLQHFFLLRSYETLSLLSSFQRDQLVKATTWDLPHIHSVLTLQHLCSTISHCVFESTLNTIMVKHMCISCFLL